MTSETLGQNLGHRILFFGDSITQSGEEPGGYVALVRERLSSETSPKEVIGAGISGNKVPDLQRRLQSDVLIRKPTLVVIYIGINDVWHSESGMGTPKSTFESGLHDIIGQIQTIGSHAVLCTPSVIGEKHDGSNALDELLDEFCEISRAVANQSGCHLLDLRLRFLDYLRSHNQANHAMGVLTTDGVHLNTAGNRFVADQMLDGIDCLLTD